MSMTVLSGGMEGVVSDVGYENNKGHSHESPLRLHIVLNVSGCIILFDILMKKRFLKTVVLTYCKDIRLIYYFLMAANRWG